MTLQDYTTEEHRPIEVGVHLMRPEQMSRTTGVEKSIERLSFQVL